MNALRLLGALTALAIASPVLAETPAEEPIDPSKTVTACSLLEHPKQRQ